MNDSTPFLPREREMPLAHAEARRRHLVLEARRTAAPNRLLSSNAFHIPALRKFAIVAVVVFAGAAAFIATASAVGWIFSTPHVDPRPAPGTSIQVHASVVINGREWAVVSFTNSEEKLCLGIRGPGGTGLSCTTQAALFSEGPLAVDSGWTGESGSGTSWVWGIAKSSVRTVSVQFSDCSEKSAALDADGYFLLITPQASTSARQPQRVTAFGDRGEMMSQKTLPGVKSDLCR